MIETSSWYASGRGVLVWVGAMADGTELGLDGWGYVHACLLVRNYNRVHSLQHKCPLRRMCSSRAPSIEPRRNLRDWRGLYR